MKLRTRLVPLASRTSADGEAADAWHDAIAAHALLQAMGELEPLHRGWNQQIRGLAADILAGWLGEAG